MSESLSKRKKYEKEEKKDRKKKEGNKKKKKEVIKIDRKCLLRKGTCLAKAEEREMVGITLRIKASKEEWFKLRIIELFTLGKTFKTIESNHELRLAQLCHEILCLAGRKVFV